MAMLYDENRPICRFVHSTSKGHEAIQLATAFHLQPYDYVSPYYRDESLLLGLGFSPYELMLQLLAKADDPFTGGRGYYAHPNYKGLDKPTIIHQSSATGMQVIPTTGIAQGVAYLELIQSDLLRKGIQGELPVVLCSLGDGSVTEGEVSEAFQFAVLKKLPVIFLVQDNGWGISAQAAETRAMDAYEYAGGFPGMHRVRVDGTLFTESYLVLENVFSHVRAHREPWLVHARVALLGHHTSGVRKEFYRGYEDLDQHNQDDPLPKLVRVLRDAGFTEPELEKVRKESEHEARLAFERACSAPSPEPNTVCSFVFAESTVKEEVGDRSPLGGEKVLMVDAALHAVGELMEACPEAILYGQDVGRRLGGVFREAVKLADKFGDHRVFNTAIQEAYVIGSTAGMSAVGVKPIVEIQFADYIFPGLNQLATELAKSCYLTCGKFPIQALIRIPTGAYGGGGPYHSGSIETTLLSIKGIKIGYPSNAADMKGLMKAAFLDPNPVVMLEHKGLYWSKIPGTEEAKMIEPARDYILPFGKANSIQQASADKLREGATCCIITYGMGVYWAKAATIRFPGQIEIVDLRTLFPLDEDMVFNCVKRHGRCLVLTEEQQNNSFAEALAGRISRACFQWLDGPVHVMGALNLPAVPLNPGLEAAMLPDVNKVAKEVEGLLNW